MYIPSFLNFLPIQVTTEHGVGFPKLSSRFLLVICFVHSVNSVCMSILVPVYPTPRPVCPLSIHTFVFYVCSSVSLLQIICTVFLDSTYMH